MLTRGGQAELVDLDDEELVVWASAEDPDFQAQFPDFLIYDDVEGILAYLVEVGELTDAQADGCEISEESLTAAEAAGMMRRSP